MAKVIEGIPESISREDYTAMFRMCGIEPNNTVSLKFTGKGVYAKVFFRAADGKRLIDGDGEDEWKCAVHEVFIPVLPYAENGNVP